MKVGSGFHCPYGRVLSVRRHNGKPSLDHADAMTMLGLHDPDVRARCQAEMEVIGVWTEATTRALFDLMVRYGGRQAPVQALPAPVSVVRKGAWLTGSGRALAAHRAALARAAHGPHPVSRWHSLAPALIAAGRSAAPADPTSAAMILTAMIEVLRESRITTLEAAALYVLTAHPGWRNAAAAYLEPMQATWFADWRRGYPEYDLLLAEIAPALPTLPAWLLPANATDLGSAVA